MVSWHVGYCPGKWLGKHLVRNVQIPMQDCKVTSLHKVRIAVVACATLVKVNTSTQTYRQFLIDYTTSSAYCAKNVALHCKRVQTKKSSIVVWTYWGPLDPQFQTAEMCSGPRGLYIVAECQLQNMSKYVPHDKVTGTSLILSKTSRKHKSESA